MKAGYVRLSRDEDKDNYASITAQKDIIKSYAKSQGWDDIVFYEDDNFSGYKFNRPALTQMLKDMEDGKIDIVLSKDLSRIGRNNALTLLFIENIKSLNKILIAIDDNYDSSKDDDEIIGIKTWYNERYVKDLSKKIRSNLNSQMRNNTYVNALPYGYIKQNISNKIIVDEKTKPIIQKIFEMYLQGNGVLKIARYLNENNIPSPFEQAKLNAEENGIIYKHSTDNKWRDGTIINILKNDFYIGIKRSKKTKRNGLHGKIVYLDEHEHYVFKNNHEPIIDEQDFYLVQELIEKRKNLNYRGSTKHYNPYSGFLFCSDCGKLMIARSQKGRQKCYVCSTYKRFKECTSHHVREDFLIEKTKNILRVIQLKIQDYLCELKTNMIDKLETEDNYNNIIKKTKLDITNLKQEHKVMLSQKIKAIVKNPDAEKIIEEQYQELEKELFRKIDILENQLENFEKLKDQSKNLESNVKNANDIIELILNNDTVDKKDLEFLIEKIIIYGNNEIDIHLKGELANLFSDRRKTNVEQVNIIYINAITYLANMYEILKVQRALQ